MNINELRRNYVYWLRIRTSAGFCDNGDESSSSLKWGYLLTRWTILMLSRQFVTCTVAGRWSGMSWDRVVNRLRPGGQGTVGAWHKQFLFSTASEMLWSPSICGCWGPFPPGSAPGPWICHAHPSIDEVKRHAAVCKFPLRLHELVFN